MGVGRGEAGVVLEGRDGLGVRRGDDGCRKKHIQYSRAADKFYFFSAALE